MRILLYRMGYPVFMMQNMGEVDILMYDLGCLLSKYVQVNKKNNFVLQLFFRISLDIL